MLRHRKPPYAIALRPINKKGLESNLRYLQNKEKDELSTLYEFEDLNQLLRSDKTLIWDRENQIDFFGLVVQAFSVPCTETRHSAVTVWSHANPQKYIFDLGCVSCCEDQNALWGNGGEGIIFRNKQPSGIKHVFIEFSRQLGDIPLYRRFVKRNAYKERLPWPLWTPQGGHEVQEPLWTPQGDHEVQEDTIVSIQKPSAQDHEI